MAMESLAVFSSALDQALRRAIILLAETDPGSSRLPSQPREENAPVAFEGSDGLRGLSQVVELLRDAIGATQAALARLNDEPNDLTLITSAADGISGPLLGPRQAYPRLRAMLTAPSAKPMVLAGEPEAKLLAQSLHLGVESSLAVLPVPSGPQRARESEGCCWALLLFFPPDSPVLDVLCDGAEEPRSFLDATVSLLGLALRDGCLDETLRERTRRMQIQHLLPGRQPPPLEHYREFFESSADGVMLLDEAARVVWMNRAAETMTGYATAGLTGYPLAELVVPAQRPALWYAVGLIVADCPVPPFDLSLYTTSSEMLVLSVSTSAVPTQPRYVVLSFRDVTEKRFLEHELRKTKEFLERLIDSTVDGIIAADISGQVVLFNQGAARITGYSADEVIGKLPVWNLYPDEEARRVMAELRSEHSGGKGRLMQSRKTIVGKNGQLIPVALSASIIYQADREVATVGVLSDLRERLLIEERLLKTEARLALSERQALLVELAGTAAHELNQPLTSVMGYAQLLQRQLPSEYSEIHDYAEILVREAERMAEIVRKIGHITRYETKDYVGDARILDLDKAILPAPSEPNAVEPVDAGPLFSVRGEPGKEPR
jgi:PAS domain S-box-containing protein